MHVDPRASAAMRDCLESLDVRRMRELWRTIAPGQAQPSDDAAALVALHAARTKCESIRFRLRAYSHAWLLDRGYPSLLPDRLKPRAQREYPIIASAVGFAMNAKSAHMREIIPEVSKAVAGAIMEAAEDGRLLEAPFVRSRIIETKNAAIRRLL